MVSHPAAEWKGQRFRQLRASSIVVDFGRNTCGAEWAIFGANLPKNG
jgi:hypothetical protein